MNICITQISFSFLVWGFVLLFCFSSSTNLPRASISCLCSRRICWHNHHKNLCLAYLNSTALSQQPAEENSSNTISLLKYLKATVLSLCSLCWFSKLDRQPQASNYTSLIQGNWGGVQFQFCNLQVDLPVCWPKQWDFRKWGVCTLSKPRFQGGGYLPQRPRLVWEESTTSGPRLLHCIPPLRELLLQIQYDQNQTQTWK